MHPIYIETETAYLLEKEETKTMNLVKVEVGLILDSSLSKASFKV